MINIRDSRFPKETDWQACPKCMSIGETILACDEEYCWEQATCGVPTKTKYRNTCSEHRPPYEKVEE